MEPLSKTLRRAWNVFNKRDVDSYRHAYGDYGPSYGSLRPDRNRLQIGNERSIIAAIQTRIAIDCAATVIRHVQKDAEGRYQGPVNSGLNYCLTVEANVDQAASFFRQDMFATMLDAGDICILPTDTVDDPEHPGSIEIKKMRVGTILEYFPYHVRVRAYREKTAQQEEIIVPKSTVGVVENPLYDVMNQPNSTLKRLIYKLNLLDAVDKQSSSGKLDLIIQLPYVIKSDKRREQAEQRRKDIEFQLAGSQYGIAYTDGTEKITQLNRAVENNLWKQIQDLKDMLYAELGVTPEVMNGTADESAMLNYHNRTIDPMLRAVAEEFARKFLTKNARTRGQDVTYYRDPFKYVSMEKMAEMADKFTRNEIVTSNEFRGFLGIPPSKDPRADELRNANMPREADPVAELEDPNVIDGEVVSDTADGEAGVLNSALDELEAMVDEILSGE